MNQREDPQLNEFNHNPGKRLRTLMIRKLAALAQEVRAGAQRGNSYRGGLGLTFGGDCEQTFSDQPGVARSRVCGSSSGMERNGVLLGHRGGCFG